VHVTLATGRCFHSARLFANDLGIHEPLICFQGALIQDPETKEVCLHCGVPSDLAREAIGFVREHGWDLCLYVDDRLYAEELSPSLRFYVECSPIKETLTVVDDLGELLSSDPSKIFVVVKAEQAATVGHLLRDRFEGRLRIVRSHTRFVEVTNQRASKGQALAFLARKLGVTQAETMAIGDNDNDADMVAWAGLGVAMGNASDAVKAVADYVAPSIEDDGAAEAIERFILERRDG